MINIFNRASAAEELERGSWKDWSDDYLTFVLERFMGGGKGEKSCC